MVHQTVAWTLDLPGRVSPSDISVTHVLSLSWCLVCPASANEKPVLCQSDQWEARLPSLPVWCLMSDINTATACCESNSIAQDCRHWAESTQDMTYKIQMFTGEHLTRVMFTFETQMFCENWDNECVPWEHLLFQSVRLTILLFTI